MFNTIESFSTVFFILSAILVLMVLFEKQCLALEDKFDAWVIRRKKAKRQNRSTHKTTVNNTKTVPLQKANRPCGRNTRNYAA